MVESYTTDRAVAICVNNTIDAAVLDQECFVETDGWSVAQSLKAVKPNLCIVLVSLARRLHKKLPQGVDAMIDADNPDALLTVLRRLMANSASSKSRKQLS